MLDKSRYENVHLRDDESQQGVKEMLSRIDVIAMIFMAVFVLFGGAIQLTRASLASTVESFHTYTESGLNFKKKGILSWCMGEKGLMENFTSFWRKFPRRIWNFYIEAFLVPGYRKEWGQYDTWCFRSAQRPVKSPQLRDFIRVQKHLRCQQQPEGDEIRVIPHNHSRCQRVRINVSGMRYETQLRTLERFPDTLLGNAVKRMQFYDPVKQEYYFDRNRNAFEAILYFYQSGGRFRRPENIQADVLIDDAQFYQMSHVIINQFKKDEGLSPLNTKNEIIPQSMLIRKIWLLFDFPESSLQAAFVAVLSIAALIVSIVVFCIETIEAMEVKPEYGVDSEGRVKIIRINSADMNDPFFFTETMCNVWFILEFFTRLLSCPFFWKFLKDPLNIIDMIAMLPFLISVSTPNASLIKDDGGTYTPEVPSTATDSLYLLRVVRVIRVFRIFKLSRHSRGLKILGKTLKASLNELVLLIFFIILGVVMFSSAMYFAEIDNPDSQITTIGFGDVVPKTVLYENKLTRLTLGRIVGALCAVAGVLTIALPVPVIVSNFNFFCHQSIDEGDLQWISANHTTACPYRPTGYNAATEKQKNPRKKPVYSSDEEFGSLKKDSS